MNGRASVSPAVRTDRNDALVRALHRALACAAQAVGAPEDAPAMDRIEAADVEDFDQAVRRLKRVHGAGVVSSHAACREARAAGVFGDADVAAALARRGAAQRFSVDDLYRHIAAANGPHEPAFASCADVVAALSGRDWAAVVRIPVGPATTARPAIAAGERVAGDRPSSRQILSVIAGRLHPPCVGGVGRSAWLVPDDVPAGPEGLCVYALERLNVPAALLDLYLQRLLVDASALLAASPAQALIHSAPAKSLLECLAIRLAWELSLLRAYAGDGAELAWRRALAGEAAKPAPDTPPGREEELDLVAHCAWELGWQRSIIRALRDRHGAPGGEARPVRREGGALRASAVPGAHAGLLAAPRDLARRCGLAGTCALHAYEARQDRDLSRLEDLMTVRLVTATRSALQVGGDGAGRVAPPRRLSAFLAAPITAINAVIERHERLRQLVDGGWLHLFALYDGGDVVLRHAGDLHWEPASGQDTARVMRREERV